MRKVKTCKKSLGTDSTLAGFPSPEQLNVTAELRTQAPDNSRAAGAAAEKSRAAGWRGSFQHSHCSEEQSSYEDCLNLPLKTSQFQG